MGQGFFGYNPPQFILDAAKGALDRVECNQYSPTKGRPRLKKALSDAYSPHWGRKLDPETEITITTGANEGMLSAFMAFIEPGDEVIVFEPFFDQYISNIEMPGGKIVYVPMHPPKDGGEKTLSAGEWTIDFNQLERAITPRTKMLVLNTPRAYSFPAVTISRSLLKVSQITPSARSTPRKSSKGSPTSVSSTKSSSSRTRSTTASFMSPSPASPPYLLRSRGLP